VNKFLYPVRVYYEDTDSGGVVYYANYLKFMERARTEWLRSLGFEQDALIQDEGVLFAVRSVQVDYHKPAKFNDQLEVMAAMTELGKASMTFAQEVRRHPGPSARESSLLLCSANVRIACLDASTLRPRAIPDSIVREISCEC
jgi:acyl-CoA thioester hydrolase